MTDGGIRLGILVASGDGTVMRALTFSSLDTSHSMEYRCNATIRFRPPPFVISKEAVWDLVVHCESILNLIIMAIRIIKLIIILIQQLPLLL